MAPRVSVPKALATLLLAFLCASCASLRPSLDNLSKPLPFARFQLGTSTSELRSAKLREVVVKDETESYAEGGEYLYQNISFVDVLYICDSKALYKSVYMIQSKSNFSKLLSLLEKHYGDSQRQDTQLENYLWHDKRTMIAMAWDPAKQMGLLIVFDLKVQTQVSSRQKQTYDI